MKNTLKLLFLSILLFLLTPGCDVEQRCYDKKDCPLPQICTELGECDFVCRKDSQCGKGFECKGNLCVIRDLSCVKDSDCDDDYECKEKRCVIRTNPPTCVKDTECIRGYECQEERCVARQNPLTCVKDSDCDDAYECQEERCVLKPKPACPEGMALISNAYCIDKFEASRPDASKTSIGSDESMASSRPNVQPWQIGDDNAKAALACKNAGKRLCTPTEWGFACHGVNNTVYGYGDEYNIYTCNGLDTHGDWMFHILPTQSLPDCHNGWGVYDLNGNLWEHTADGSGKTVRGGAFNCADSQTNHRCDYVPNYWTPSALGFRCCADKADVTAKDGAQKQKSTKRIMTSYMPPIEKPTPSDAIAEAQKRWKKKAYQDALNLLKEAREIFPEDKDILRAIGISYAHLENYPWAIRSFKALLNDDADDCSARLWLVWTYLQMANLEEIPELLEHPSCKEKDLFARQRLLSAFVAMTENKAEAAKRDLALAYQVDALSDSDADALVHMSQQMGVSAPPSMTWSLEASAGYASNALSGSPHDPKLTGKAKDSGIAELDFRLGLDPFSYVFVRPKGEVRARGQWLFAKDAVDASYLDLSSRLGITAEWPGFGFSAFYRPEFLILKGGDVYDKGPLLFYQAHRLELDVEISDWLYVFAGYGQRQFRQAVRTRSEFDIALGAHHRLVSTLALIWSVGYRYWNTKDGIYDLHGAHLSLVLDYRFPRSDIRLRINGAYSLDDYPHSQGYFDDEHKRRDHALRGTFQAWSPSWAGVRIGVIARASRRFSSAPNYDFEDYRAQISLKYSGDLDFYAPKRRPNDVFGLPWAFERQGNSERIRDLIQQDEDIQSSSSCLQN